VASVTTYITKFIVQDYMNKQSDSLFTILQHLPTDWLPLCHIDTASKRRSLLYRRLIRLTI